MISIVTISKRNRGYFIQDSMSQSVKHENAVAIKIEAEKFIENLPVIFH